MTAAPSPVGRIITVTPNPALDVTYAVPRLEAGEVHRVTTVRQRAGGKGVNVARVLRALGIDVTATGFVGGPTGASLCEQLAADAVTADFVEALDEVRRTLVVHGEDGVTTSLWEPGHPLLDPDGAVGALVATVEALLPGAGAVVVSGSLPPGAPANLPARLAAAAAAAGVAAVVDADGEPLRLAASGARAVLMPNRDELARLTGATPQSVREVAAAARRLCRDGVPAVVATLGADGMLARTADAAWFARPVRRLDGNPTGAGDAAAAAVAAGLSRGGPPDWAAVLADAVALSAAAVVRPVAGEVDLDAYRTWRHQVVVEPIPVEDPWP